VADEQCPEFIEGAGALSTPRPLDKLGTRQAQGDASSGHRLEHLAKTALEIEDEVQRQNRELWTINAVAEAISQSFDLDDILNNVVSKLTAVMGIEASWVYLIETQEKEEGPELSLKAHWGV
jgi:hypothetical protein